MKIKEKLILIVKSPNFLVNKFMLGDFCLVIKYQNLILMVELKKLIFKMKQVFMSVNNFKWIVAILKMYWLIHIFKTFNSY
jgi:hypothetical protein